MILRCVCHLLDTEWKVDGGAGSSPCSSPLVRGGRWGDLMILEAAQDQQGAQCGANSGPKEPPHPPPSSHLVVKGIDYCRGPSDHPALIPATHTHTHASPILTFISDNLHLHHHYSWRLIPASKTF